MIAYATSSDGLSHTPPPVTYSNVIKSPLNPDITISYNTPADGTCMTAFSNQKQYTGYIQLPPYSLAPIQQNYTINTFFWFVEARQAPASAPLTIWLSGGPGTSSMFGLFNEIGPCQVVQLSDGTYGTQTNTWGWDRSSNLLFVDQPNEVGFSFDVTTNASYNLLTGEVFEPPTPPNPSLPSYMYLNGTFGSSSLGDKFTTPWAATANTTDISAQATYHFLQGWLSAFPQYNPAVRPNTTQPNPLLKGPVGINLFAESYGGKYGPTFARYFEEMNKARSNGTLSSATTLEIKLETLGIINGLVDDLIQDQFYPTFAYNNTYAIQAINQVEELNDINLYTNECAVQIQTCRSLMASTDPDGYGDVPNTNAVCEQAQVTCNQLLIPYLASGRYPYDIRQMTPSPDPPAAYQEYLNNETVLATIGAKINYTENNPYVQDGFISTGDTIRGGLVQDIAYLLSNGVRVGLLYGDADYICNWLGGEAISLAIAAALPNYPPATWGLAGSSTPPTYSVGFPQAGYADIVTNSSYVGGAVRQYGNLSFSRIYEAGHFVPYFQPETAFTVFTRIIQGSDISTGDLVDLSSYGSTGPANATYTNTASYSPTPTCWVRAWNQSCSDQDTEAMKKGQGFVANGIFYLSSVSGLPSSSVAAGVPGHPMSTTSKDKATLTGVYTATGTPTQSGDASLGPRPVLSGRCFGPVLAVVLGLLVGVGVVLEW